ncbi:MAG TPA: hypothetical protein VEP48_12705 [Methylomirabilota bacterium]|nr:hypothetical protein [Methylomirabilota bacterium]
MRPFRSRALTALVTAFLFLGLLGTVALADEVPTTSFPEDPWDRASAPTMSFPEDPWPGLAVPMHFPEDPWPGVN